MRTLNLIHRQELEEKCSQVQDDEILIARIEARCAELEDELKRFHEVRIFN